MPSPPLRPAFAAPSFNPLRRAGHVRRLHTPTCSASGGVVLAPGQGAQFSGMGRTWSEASPAAAAVFAAADAALGDALGAPLSELIFSADAATLARTDVAQPAIFATSMACWAGMVETGAFDKDALTATAGLSLGEYTALALSGAIAFEDALKLVALRGRAMQDAAEASQGGMVALLGADEDKAMQVVDACKDGDVLVAANFNAPGQVVLSGMTGAVDRAAKYASGELKLRVAKLDVAGAFHSPLMQPAADRLGDALEKTQIGLPDVPVMSNVTGEPHTVGSIREMLVKQLTSPVRWAKCVDYMKAEKTMGGDGQPWVELAPGKTLSGIMRKIDRKLKVANFDQAPVEA